MKRLEAEVDQATRFGKLERKQRTNKFFKVEKRVERKGQRGKHSQIFLDDDTNDFSWYLPVLSFFTLEVTLYLFFGFRKFWVTN